MAVGHAFSLFYIMYSTLASALSLAWFLNASQLGIHNSNLQQIFIPASIVYQLLTNIIFMA